MIGYQSGLRFGHLDVVAEHLVELCAQLDGGLRDEEDKPLPFSVREGGFIRPGYNPKVDELRDLLANANGHIIDMEVKVKERTGIKNMKITSNKVFGYYIEVAKSQTGLVPDHSCGYRWGQRESP